MKRSDISDLEVCQAVQAYQDDDSEFPYARLMRLRGAPYKVAYAACERAADNGLIECGVSLRTGWLTEKGKALLASASSAS